MSFGQKVIAAARALAAEGRLPSTLRPVERNARVLEKMIDLGQTLGRHLDRYLGVVDAKRPLCTSTNAADGDIVAADDSLEHEDEMEAEPRALEEITQSVRHHLLHVPHDTAVDVALAPSYLRRLAHSNIKSGDSLEWRSVDMSWIARALIVSVVKAGTAMATNPITYKLLMPPTFLMGHAETSGVHIIDQINALEREYHQGKVGAHEYEGRLRILQALRDDGGRYPQDLVRRRLTELSRALDAGLLSRPQHAQSEAELLALLVDEPRVQEMSGGANPEPVVDGGETAKKKPLAGEH
jgi:hypothetical protein